jgi:hypothetical protein
MKKQEIQTLKGIIEKILAENPQTRNNDMLLIKKVYAQFGVNVVISEGFKSYIPPFESITRIRRKLQENGQFQADLNIYEQRSANEEEMRNINIWFQKGFDKD